MVVISFQTVYYFFAIISIVCSAAYKLSLVQAMLCIPALRDFVAPSWVRSHDVR